MKHPRLYWHLVRFHLQVAPWWMMPLLLFSLAPLSLIGFSLDNISRNNFYSNDQIMPFLYFFILASQLTWGMRWGRQMAQNQAWTTGSYAFLFTRSIHRSTLYWAKLSVFFAICLIPLLPTLGKTMMNPDIRIQLERSPDRQSEKIARLQTSFPDLEISTPQQNSSERLVTLAGAGWSWFFFKFIQISLIGLSILWLCSLSWRWPRIWIPALSFFVLSAFTPLFFLLLRKKDSRIGLLYDDEGLLLWTHGHLGLIAAAMTVLAGVILWDSRRRFLRLPQYKGAMI